MCWLQVVAAQQVEVISGLPRFECEESRQWLMNQGRTVFSQLISFLPDRDFRALRRALSGRPAALMHSLVRFSHVAAADTFTTKEVHIEAAEALGVPPEKYSLASVRYELSKLRAKGLVEKLPHSRRYRLLPNGYRICLVFLKLFEKIHAPLTAGLLHPYRGDRLLLAERLSQLDRLYQAVVTAVDNLATAVGLKVAA